MVAAFIGYAKKKGWTEKVPIVGKMADELGEDLAIAALGFVALKMNVVPPSMRKHVVNLTLCAAILAAHEAGETGHIQGFSKKEETTEAKTSGIADDDVQGTGRRRAAYEVK